jgi:hypothetical protein
MVIMIAIALNMASVLTRAARRSMRLIGRNSPGMEEGVCIPNNVQSACVPVADAVEWFESVPYQ